MAAPFLPRATGLAQYRAVQAMLRAVVASVQVRLVDTRPAHPPPHLRERGLGTLGAGQQVLRGRVPPFHVCPQFPHRSGEGVGVNVLLPVFLNVMEVGIARDEARST